MMKEKYILNSNCGINGIDKISLKKIIEKFSFPKDIEIFISKDKITLDIDLIYNKMKVYYTLNYFVENLKKVEFHSLYFNLDKLYLNNNEYIKIGDDIRKVLYVVRKYLKRTNKSLEFEYREDEYFKKYDFDDDKINLSFKKKGNRSFLDYILVSLPYEDLLPDSKILEEIKDIMELKKLLDKIFYRK